MSNTDKFLSLYKEYENIVRGNNLDPKDYEEKLDELSLNRLRMCRYFRNFFSHQNDPGFLVVSDKQLTFMGSTIKTLKTAGDTVKKHLKTVASATCAENDRCTDALTKCIKLKSDKIVVIGKKTIGIASIYDISEKVMQSKTTKISEIKLKSDYYLVKPDMDYAKIPTNTVIVCTQDGTKEGRVLGVIYN